MRGASELDGFDDELRPYLSLLGAIAVDSARIEWGLSGLLGFLTNIAQDDALHLAIDRQVKEIKRGVKQVPGWEASLFAGAVLHWAGEAQRLLVERGNLMHSAWIVGSDTEPADQVRSGWIASQAEASPKGTVYSHRLRGDGTPTARPLDELRAFVTELHEHMSGYPVAWMAAGILVGTFPEPQRPAPPSSPGP